jgi:pimeloyl-ACP methyl ester carboxylesterase
MTAPFNNPGLRTTEGGTGGPLLVLLHGLGATSDVWERWRPVLARRWPGRWIAPDLPGHGGSPPLPEYTFESIAAAVAEALPEPDGNDLVVLGHSLGGVIGLTLAANAGGQFGVRVTKAIGLGIKTAWTQEELDRAKAFADRPTAWFDSRDEAATRYLRVSGLTGLLAADDPAVDAGLRRDDGQWRLAFDPRTFAVGAPDLPRLLAAIPAPVVLARGQLDPMNSDEQLAELGVRAVTLPGLHHNAHVEDPELCAVILESP